MEGEGVQPVYITKYKFVPPYLIRMLYPEVLWETSCKKVLLTIDDSPSPDTLRVLDLLDTHAIKAAFFVNIPKTEKNRGAVREIIKRGHTLANHGMTHKKLRSVSAEVLQDQVVSSKLILEEITGEEVRFFRPPYGAFDFATYDAIRDSGQRLVMWTLLTGDYKGDIKLSTTNVKKYLGKNSIVVMHDNHKSKGVFEDTLTVLVQTVNKKEFVLGAPEECLR